MRNTQKHLIVTIVIGDEIESLAKYTVPSIKRYARKVGADFKQLGTTEITENFLPMYEKNQIRDFFDRYEKVLFIDADILITPDAPDLFEVCDGKNIGAVSVEKIYAKAEREKESLQKVLGNINWNKDYFNSGVMLFTKEYKEILNTDDGLIPKWVDAKQAGKAEGLNDQSVFNYRVNKLNVPITFVDKGFNFTRAFGCFEKRFSQYFIHYAGLRGNRLTRIKIDNFIMNNAFMYKLLKASPKATWLFDKVSLRIL